MNSKSSRKKDPRIALFYAAVTALALLFIGLTGFFIVRMNRGFYSYTSEPDAILRMLNRGDYAGAWREVKDNRASGQTEEKEPAYELPYAAVDYYEAKSYYNVYADNGETEKAEIFRRDMDQAYEKMGELQFLAEDIDAMFDAG